MYNDETVEAGSGFPALVRFEKNEAGAPLAVFITGGGVFARIAYGHPEGRPSDFLCHWLKEAGYSTLALTYPLGAPPFGQAWPTFTVNDWAEQSAEIVARYRQIDGLPTNVVVLAWSMAGRIAAPLAKAMRRRGVDIELFVAMAASPGLPNLLPGFASLAADTSGLARVEALFLKACWLASRRKTRRTGAPRSAMNGSCRSISDRSRLRWRPRACAFGMDVSFARRLRTKTILQCSTLPVIRRSRFLPMPPRWMRDMR
jgi:hypothetical protein